MSRNEIKLRALSDLIAATIDFIAFFTDFQCTSVCCYQKFLIFFFSLLNFHLHYIVNEKLYFPLIYDIDCNKIEQTLCHIIIYVLYINIWLCCAIY